MQHVDREEKQQNIGEQSEDQQRRRLTPRQGQHCCREGLRDVHHGDANRNRMSAGCRRRSGAGHGSPGQARRWTSRSLAVVVSPSASVRFAWVVKVMSNGVGMATLCRRMSNVSLFASSLPMPEMSIRLYPAAVMMVTTSLSLVWPPLPPPKPCSS